MLDHAFNLRQPINLFITGADELFGPITVVRSNNRIVKKIQWIAFKLLEQDWIRVADARDILADANTIQQVFSSEKEPTLWRAIPALERLLSAWEAKKKKPRFEIYKDALSAGLAKITKYYLLLDQKPSFVLALVLHPYYKLNYITMAWGGEAEQKAEREAGNLDAKNWQDEAMKILETT
ncbi:hypothetical protein H0H92_015451, partial [Tricholoma furcatifolium]